jgi:hypothetical protein
MIQDFYFDFLKKENHEGTESMEEHGGMNIICFAKKKFFFDL